MCSSQRIATDKGWQPSWKRPKDSWEGWAGLLPLFWGFSVLHNGQISFLKPHVESPARVTSFIQPTWWDWHIFGKKWAKCMKSVWLCDIECMKVCEYLKFLMPSPDVSTYIWNFIKDQNCLTNEIFVIFQNLKRVAQCI